jgi:hypothetical protein
MKFCDYRDIWSCVTREHKRMMTVDEFYHPGPGKPVVGQNMEGVRFALEGSWRMVCRPYYKVWPSVLDSILKIKLDTTLSQLTIPHDVLCVRFPRSRERSISSVLAATTTIEGRRCLLFTYQYVNCSGNLRDGGCLMTCDSEGTIEDVITECREKASCGKFLGNGSHWDVTAPEADKYGISLRALVGVSLLAIDPSIIEPDVLTCDQKRYHETGDQKYADRAKRRGKFGFHVGRKIESMPHYRRPHFGLRHTGKGGKIPKIVPIKGTVVHRKKVTDVPTGYILPDGREIE